MFCNNCGVNLEDGAKFCDNCGAAAGAASTVNESYTENKANSGKGLLYATIIIALISAVLPFLHWVEVPALNTLSAWFGGSSDAASYTLFGYIFAGVSDSVVATAVICILAIASMISVIFNVIYCVKAFLGKVNAEKYASVGAVILLIMAVLFWVIVGLIALIIKVIKLTSTVYVAIILPIVNLVLINKLKKN